MGNLLCFTASSACLLCVKSDRNWISILAGEIPAFRTVGFEYSGGETVFNLLPTRSLLLRQSDLSREPELVPGT